MTAFAGSFEDGLEPLSRQIQSVEIFNILRKRERETCNRCLKALIL